MSIKQDWLEHQIEDMGRTLAAILFGKERLQSIFEDFKEKEETNSDTKMKDITLEVYISSCLRRGEISKAENLLLSLIENKKTLKRLIIALSFYNRLLESSDEYLRQNSFSRDKIKNGIEHLKLLYSG